MTTIPSDTAAEIREDRAFPAHIAIIMDGNGRWAAERGLPRSEGHRCGVEAVQTAVRSAIEMEIKYLTLFSFSSENWSRPADEIRDLMTLLKRFIRTDLADLHKHGVRIRVIGARKGVEGEVVKMIEEAVSLTSRNEGLQLTVAFNYGARDEIVRATKNIARRVAEGTLDPDEITDRTFEESLDTAGLPNPDLLIRTSGEMRLSNFLLWQCAYTEFAFLDMYWPDFSRTTLEEAIAIYQSRERRYGGLAARSTA